MSEEHHESTEEVNSFPTVDGRDLEYEITFAIVFNWFIGLPIIALVFIISSIYISNNYLKDKFIDEIFHVSMVEQYFKGDFKTWDSKITTPPGLYYLGYVWAKLIQLLHIPINPVGLNSLRLINAIGGAVVLPISLNSLFILNPIGFWQTNIVLFPILSTFYYFFYTDVWSTVFIISSLSTAIGLPFGDKLSIKVSAILGFLSIWFRQTNIIWNLLVLVFVIERRATIQKNFTDSFLNNCIKFIIQFFEDFWEFSLPYIINFVLFFGFLIYNRGITLGDKENHVAGFHLIQFFYCISFITFFTWPVWISTQFIKDYLRRFRLGFILVVLEILGIWIIIRFFTVIHPFLLADNRHYTFYIFRKIINYSFFRKYIIMGQIYHFSTYVFFRTLNSNAFEFNSINELPFKLTRDLPLKPTGISIWTLTICIILTVVPSPLFEPRYYIVPFIIYRLFISVPFESYYQGQNLKNVTLVRLFCELLWLILINIVVILMFTFYTFSWDTESNPQRIIW
ncbi:hypothetical protein WICMUC_005795 [Wickerhamomyces mucosus]|uniref:Dol-P-Glc:Glc(2)Man(9)GlcNAc(2)-PP-Dol alpha-1,2-glucosyltransferase n=1 Tax=Wickerhamomyces mucosus TaxID=1378264 RepID=A0A9P8P374_9ASCO|nr:hypothetical protein WICMUC_005795 [Wickerhamomyces mucosus]